MTHEDVIGFDATPCPAGQSVKVSKAPDKDFQAEHLIIPSMVGVNFVVESIEINGLEQLDLRDSGPVPASAFSEDNVGIRMKLDASPANVPIVIRAKNTSTTTRDFTAALIGLVEKD
jgi:hypothetical protein